MTLERPPTLLRAYVGSIGMHATERDLHAAFARVGVPLDDVELVINRATGCLRGFAFVVIAGGATDASVDDIVARMRLASLDDHQLTVHPIAADLIERSGSHRIPRGPRGPS